jgi:superfamily II DNA or RNA helicase
MHGSVYMNAPFLLPSFAGLFVYTTNTSLAPGARVLIRDAEWVVRRVDSSSDGGQQLTCEGLSEIVRDKEAIFLTALEDSVQVLDPATTEMVGDSSPGYQDSLLYMESLLRQATPNDERIHLGHRAAMDLVPYQLDPALQALKQPRQRILIADAVGLGKTLEAGILVTELMQRGKGKRILVLTLKSMMTQFQKELWNRFSIPLTRLDSIGLQRVRNRIPTNHNPFHYYDKSIISIDTLKQDSEYRVYLEQAYWDIIIIDEAHNVAERGTSSMRARLARLLSRRSDTLIMLSATPHDGSARSFASLMNMLDPTAIVDPDNYVKDDFSNKGLVVRRFKKDIKDQVEEEFKEREVKRHTFGASAEEEHAYDALLQVPFTRAGVHDAQKPSTLLRVTLQKALFSSPAACLESVGKRIELLRKQQQETSADDIDAEVHALEDLSHSLEQITATRFAKYRELVNLLQSASFNWSPRNADDRLVIFSERIETLNFLQKHLQRDLKLKENQIDMLHGSLGDLEQQEVVERFGKDSADVRILLCSDVASEGINLHHKSYRLIHFDMPWSLMVFQQRNGRIDRYGQRHIPQIYYLITESTNPTVRGDMRILEVLEEKDRQAYANIGDPSAFMGVYDIQKEELITREAMVSGTGEKEFDARTQPKEDEADMLLALFRGTAPTQAASETEQETSSASSNEKQISSETTSLFESDYHFCKRALSQLANYSDGFQFSSDDTHRRISLSAPEDLRHRFSMLSREVIPEKWHFILSDDLPTIKQEIERCRQDENAWPKIHYLWPQHPVLEWLQDRMLVVFGRHKAPVLELNNNLEEGEAVFVISGQIPNRKSHPLIYQWVGVCFCNGAFSHVEPFAQTLARTALGREAIPNRASEHDFTPLEQLLPRAVDEARTFILDQRNAFEEEINQRLDRQIADLERLRQKQVTQLEFAFEQSRELESVKVGKRRQKLDDIDRIFDEYMRWIEDTLTTEKHPHLQVISVLAQTSLLNASQGE